MPNGLKASGGEVEGSRSAVTEEPHSGSQALGLYQSVDNGDRHQVKRIIVKRVAAFSAEASSS